MFPPAHHHSSGDTPVGGTLRRLGNLRQAAGRNAAAFALPGQGEKANDGRNENVPRGRWKDTDID
jgi:hypothetical protein